MILDIAKFPPFRHVMKPYEHQRQIFEKTRSWEASALFWEMGTGKTKPLIDTAAWLFLNQEIDGLLVVSDKGAYMNWVLEEIPKHLDPEIPRRMAHWGSVMRKPEREASERLLIPKDDVLDIGCVNIEAFSSERGYDWARRFLESHHAMMVIDESTSIKNPKAARTRNAWRLGELAEYRRIASGTPITQGPLDLFGQCHFLRKGLIGHWNFTTFKAAYAIITNIKMGTRTFPKLLGYQNLDSLKRVIDQFASRITKAECLDLPPKVYETEFVEMTPEQRAAYDTLKQQAVLQIEQRVLTVTSALTVVEKLHQICCGHFRDDEGYVVELPHNRIETLLNLMDMACGKVLIWCCYTHDVDRILIALKEHWAGTGKFAVDYYGRTDPKVRVTNLQAFHENPNCAALVGTPACGGKGLTLVESSYVIYYSQGYKLEHRLQSEDRNHRIGQTRSVTYIDLACPNSIDTKITTALRAKKDLANEILDMDRLRALLD